MGNPSQTVQGDGSQLFIMQLIIGMNSFEYKRQQMMRNVRRQQISKHFESVRDQYNRPLVKEEFMKVYKQVDDQNYPQFKSVLRRYSFDEEYAILISAFSAYIYEHIIAYYNDSDSLDILKNITMFEEVDIPQTDQFADWLLFLVNKSAFDSLIIVGNLLSIPKYQSLLRDLLLQRQFLAHVPINQYLQQKRQIQISLIAQIQSVMISSHPIIQHSLYQQVSSSILPLLNNNQAKWLLGNAFIKISSTFIADENYASILMETFQRFMISQFTLIPYECLTLLRYCADCSVYSKNKKLQNNVGNSLQIQYQNRQIVILQALSVIKRYCAKSALACDNMMEKLVCLFKANKNYKSIRCKCLQIMHQHYRTEIQLTFELIEDAILDLNDGDKQLKFECLKFLIVLANQNEKYLEIMKSFALEKTLESISEKQFSDMIETLYTMMI